MLLNTEKKGAPSLHLQELRSFVAAAKLKSISKAADHLGIGQPTVSTHIKRLEEKMGTVLFDRIRRPIQLTPSGGALAGLATPLVDGIDALATMASAVERNAPVTIASTHDIVSHALLRAVRVFLRRHPHARLRIRSGLIGEVLDMVAGGLADLGLTPAPERYWDFDFVPIFTSERVLIAPLGHPLLETPLTSLDQIARWPLILRRRETHTSKMLEEEFQRRGLSYEIVVELDSMDMVKRYVAVGMGVSVGPRLAIEPEDESTLGIVSLANLLPVEPAGIVTLRGKTLSTPAMSFIEEMKNSLSLMPSGR
jgi:DNA-binding transcriptional LysR family regulator